MRVFRCITAREISGIYTGIEREKINVRTGENLFNYDKNTKYIHFFRYSKSAEYYYKSEIYNFNSLDNFIAYMVCNIPNDILKAHFSYGLYSSVENLNIDYCPLPEYAIPSNLFKRDYIITVNNFIEYNYRNNEEYELYINLLAELAITFKGNGRRIANYLLKNNLNGLLNVIDDERTEKQIEKDYIKNLALIFKELKD